MIVPLEAQGRAVLGTFFLLFSIGLYLTISMPAIIDFLNSVNWVFGGEGKARKQEKGPYRIHLDLPATIVGFKRSSHPPNLHHKYPPYQSP